MLNTQLIIIDGIPGSGKSTAGQMLEARLAELYIPHKFYRELEENHPLCIYDRQIESLGSYAEATWYQNRVKELFRAFVENRSKVAEVTIIESWLFQDHLGVAHCSGMDTALLEELYGSLTQILAPLNPTVIYYYQVNVEQNWRRICDLRGPEFTQGRCGLYTDDDFRQAGETWTTVRDLSVKIIANWDTPKLIIRNEDYNWERYNREIFGFLQLDYMV